MDDKRITAEEMATADKEITVIKDNTVTKAQLNALDSGSSADYSTLTVTAYAVQYVGNATAADAWAKVTANTNP